MSALFVGVDLGTSAVKVGLFNAEGQLLRLVRKEYSLYSPQPGWTEQEPEEWWAATCAALQEVLTAINSLQITAVGLSGQSPGHVLVSAAGMPIGRAIIWSDRRATREATWLAEHITPQQAQVWTGYPFINDATQPPARLIWLKKHRADDWARCDAIVQPKDFLALRLTGKIATDCHSSFCLFNAQTARYEEEYLSLLGIELGKMPPVLAPTDIMGHVTPEAAKATGLPVDVPVVTGTIDAWCDIIGCGAVTSGYAVDISGTSEVVAIVTDSPRHGAGVFSSPLLERLYWVGGPMQSGGATLLWLAKNLKETSFEQLEAEAARSAPGAAGLLFLPYLQGERAPVWDTIARGVFAGLTTSHTQAHFIRAVYEGIAFAVRDILERSQSVTHIRPTELRVSGGASRSAFWNQIKADVTGLPVQQMTVFDAACLGAAMLASVGTGVFKTTVAAAEAMVHPAAVFTPRQSLVALYDKLFAIWCELYPALQPVFARLDKIVQQNNLGQPMAETSHGENTTLP